MITNYELKLLVFILVAYFYHFQQSDAIITITAGNSTHWHNFNNEAGLSIFQVLDNTVIVPNNHRANSSLKFSLGSSIVQVELKKGHGPVWNSFQAEIQLQDKSRVTFSIINESNDATHYNLVWHGGGPNGPKREVCFHPDFNAAAWFDTYQPRDSATWPMKIVKNQTKKPFNNLLFNKFYEQFAELIFYNSDGFAVVLDENQPLHARRQAGEDSLLCFSVNNTHYYPNSPDPTYLDIKVHLYASSNIRSVLDYVTAISPHVPKPSVAPPEDAFARTSWTFYEGDKNTFDYSGFLHQIVQNGFTRGEIVTGDGLTSASKTVWPGLDSLIPAFVKHDFQFKYVVRHTVIPKDEYVSDWDRYRYTGGDWTDGFVGPTIDFSNPSAAEWFASENNQLLRNLRGRIHSVQANRFLWWAGPDFKCHDEQYEKYPNRLLTKYVETIANLKELNSSSYVSTKVAYKNQYLPIVLQLWMRGEYQTAPGYLQSLITHALSVAVSGYSYFATNPIGSSEVGLTDELYIRWVQASTFMPHITFIRYPWLHGQAVVNITRQFVNLHTQYVPLMMQLARERIQTGAPVVRPMWYIEPDNRAVYNIVDQFMLGADLVVAPVLKAGVRERTVHLPPGAWLDQHGKRFEGAQLVKVQVPLEELPYFTRV